MRLYSDIAQRLVGEFVWLDAGGGVNKINGEVHVC